jgi:hypothetical protein
MRGCEKTAGEEDVQDNLLVRCPGFATSSAESNVDLSLAMDFQSALLAGPRRSLARDKPIG